jgi:tetratricopeptide (TPR) repeat protein
MKRQAPNPKPFSPPDAEKVSEHLSRWAPTPPSPWAARAPMIVLIASLVLMLVLTHPLAAVLPWLALGGILIQGAWRVRTARTLEREVTGLGEQAMLRRYRAALRRAWMVLPWLVHHPSLHGRTVAALAQSLDDLGAYESAIAAYDHLLEGMPEQGPPTMHLRISRAVAALRADHLADGDETLRKVRGAIDPYLGSPIGAAFRMAQLIQDVRTHHYADALDFEPTLLDDLRPLGVEAGFGHALMALCCQAARSETPRDTERQRALAQRWWQRARTLLPEQTLLNEFPELSPLKQENP